MDTFRGQQIFVDTNILYYATSFGVEFGSAAKKQLEELMSYNEMCVSGQILREYAHVTLRMARIQHMNWDVAHRDLQLNLDVIQKNFKILFDDVEVMMEWQDLLPHATSNKQVFDLNIVATMRAHGLQHLFTHNVGDFAAFPDLVLIPLQLPR